MNFGIHSASIDIMYLAYLVVSSIQFTSTLTWSMVGWTRLYAGWNVQFQAEFGWATYCNVKHVHKIWQPWRPTLFLVARRCSCIVCENWVPTKLESGKVANHVGWKQLPVSVCIVSNLELWSLKTKNTIGNGIQKVWTSLLSEISCTISMFTPCLKMYCFNCLYKQLFQISVWL